MTTAVQRRRGTSTEHSTFTGLDGEITVNTTTYTLHIHDGATVGGVALAKADGSNLVTSSIDINGGTIDGTVIGGSTPAAGTFTTLTASGEITANGGIALGDSDKATFGASDDLQIYHDGSHSYISDAGTGDLNISGDNLYLKKADGSKYLYGVSSTGQVRLYYGDSQKFITTSTGVDVTGTVTAGGLTVDGDLAVSSANSRVRLFETDTTDLNTQLQNQAGEFNISRLDDDAGGSTLQFSIDHSTGNVSIPNGNLDVTGTVTADGLTVDGNGAVNGALTADEITTSKINVGANLAWNSSTDTYTANTTPSTVTKIHEGMKRCVLRDDGTVNYYLNPLDSTEKLDGTAANIDGTDGNVMVEIPRFYFRQVKNGSTTTWEISDVPLAGYQLHPAFFKNGEIVDFRYIGAYDACYLDATDSTYKSGLNLDDMTSNLDIAADKLASVSGVYPLVGVTRDECRSLAANVGSGWRQQDFWLTCAVQMLYLVEYGDFNSQSNLGNGNVSVSTGYPASSSSQTDSPHSVAGKSNSLGNASTDTTSGASSATRDTAFMSYRGIENFYGNCWSWVDGFNIGIVVDRDVWVSNTDTDFADNTSTNYTQLNGTMATANGYASDILDQSGTFLPSATSGSSSTYLADYFYQATGNRVALFGGNAYVGATAGAFCWVVSDSSSRASRGIGARLCF